MIRHPALLRVLIVDLHLGWRERAGLGEVPGLPAPRGDPICAATQPWQREPSSVSLSLVFISLVLSLQRSLLSHSSF